MITPPRTIEISKLRGTCARTGRQAQDGDRVRRFYVGQRHECWHLVPDTDEAVEADARRAGVADRVPEIEIVIGRPS